VRGIKYSDEIIKQFVVGSVYLIVAIIVLSFATVEGNASLLWPSSGIALAVLIRFGVKYVIGIFLGAFAAGIYVGNPHLTSSLIALGNTLEPLMALYLLKFLPFSRSLYRFHDYLSLILAGSVGAIVSAVLGTSALIQAGFIPVSDFLSVAGYWWMGDALGVLLIAPFLLMLSLHSFRKMVEGKTGESLLLFVTATGISFLVMTNWNHELMMRVGGTYILIIPLAWSTFRFSQSMTSIIIFEYFVVGVWGLLNQQGLFMSSGLEPNLHLFWIYFVVISLVAHAGVYSVSERNTLFQAINSSKTETYVFCEGDMTFEFVNRVALDNLGLTLAQALMLTPLDIKPLFTQEKFDDLLAPLVNKEVDIISFETVHQRKNGTIYPVEVTLQSVQHANRVCYLASVVDIAEREEREQHRILGNHVCDISTQAIMITDSNNAIVRVNPAFTEITGYSFDEVLGENPHILSSGRNDDVFYQELWADLNEQGEWEGEIYNRRKNGSLYLQHLSIKVLHDTHGNVKNHIAMFSDITDEREQSIKLQHLSEHDMLTGLPNRRRLEREFKFALTSAKRHRNKIALLFFDLNNFKPINDNYGHMYGDEVLQEIATRMLSVVRDSDVVARIGGDEFVVLMTDVESGGAVQTLVTKLQKTIAEPIIAKGVSFNVSASCGVAEYPEHGDSLEVLLNISDSEMYKNKAEV